MADLSAFVGTEEESIRTLVNLFARVRELLGEQAGVSDYWTSRLDGLQPGESERLRVAVAGTVKSGKTTLVNALIGQDLLKRGAGIITSLVTRVRPGPELRAEMLLKGWQQVNQEATEAALFLGGEQEVEPLDLRADADQSRLQRILDDLGEEAFGEGGFFDKNVALLRALLSGCQTMRRLLQEQPSRVLFGADDFERHREFAGSDALAAFVDDLILEVPGLPFSGSYEIGDCQGYDSPNPRHMERVQDYLTGAHLVVYVVSSRVGLREADLRFLRDIKALGLADATRFVLNADLTEHGVAADLSQLRERVLAEGRDVVGALPIHTFSALRALLRRRSERGESLSRKETLLMELWEESETDFAESGFPAFLEYLQQELGAGRDQRLSQTRAAVVRRAAAVLRSRVEAGLLVAGREVDDLAAEEKELAEARQRVESSLGGFEGAIYGLTGALKKDLYRRIDAVFHPAQGSLAQQVVAHVKMLPAPPIEAQSLEKKKIFRHMAKMYQEMKEALHHYKVREVNPRAVDEIRAVWGGVSRDLAQAAAAPAAILVESVDAYRDQAFNLGIEIPAHELPELDPQAGRKPIPLFSSERFGSSSAASEQVLGFARKWTRKVAVGWARRLVRKNARKSFSEELLEDAAAAVRELLAEDTYWNLLNYNETVKYQVLGKSVEELAQAWTDTYRKTVEALVLDLDELADRIRQQGAHREDLIPQLREVLGALEPIVG